MVGKRYCVSRWLVQGELNPVFHRLMLEGSAQVSITKGLNHRRRHYSRRAPKYTPAVYVRPLKGCYVANFERDGYHKKVKGVVAGLFGVQGVKSQRKSRSGYSGISFKTSSSKWKWEVRIEVGGFRKAIGHYSCAKEAAAAYDLYVSQIVIPIGGLSKRPFLNYEAGLIEKNYLCEPWDDFDDSWDFPTVDNIAKPVKPVEPVLFKTPNLSYYPLHDIYEVGLLPILEI